ncbi:hypothetical protein BDV93DRAFT_601440 [Ceratobasidium sp. AG-I]|nr:hypothetical protein BDV93DRAFT_601440 [Ceratobasidium sp. AG-I]
MEYSSFIFMLQGNSLDVVYVSESVSDVLEFNQQDLLNRPLELFLNPDEKDEVMSVLRDTAQKDKAACLAYFMILHKREGFVACTVAHSAANNIIVGSVSQAAAGAAVATERNGSAEEVMVITDSIQLPGDEAWRSRRLSWPNQGAPRTAFVLDRFSNKCAITHCTNGAILNPETCVGPQSNFFKYVAKRDEERVRSFIAGLKRSGIGAAAPADAGFRYEKFTMCVSGRELAPAAEDTPADSFDEVQVSVIGSAASDGLILIVRRDA